MNVPKLDLTIAIDRKNDLGWQRDSEGHLCLRCPHNHVATLNDYMIAADGTVLPLYQCPMCDYREAVRLLDYLPVVTDVDPES